MVQRIVIPVPGVSGRSRGVPAQSGSHTRFDTHILESFDEELLGAIPGRMGAVDDDPEQLLRTEFFDADRMRGHLERFEELLGAESHLAALRFDPIRVAQICERESLPPVGAGAGDDAARRKLFEKLCCPVTLRKAKRTIEHAYRESARRLERATRAAIRKAAKNSRNPGRRCRGRPPAELPKGARWADPAEARKDLLAVTAALIHLTAHRSLGLPPEQNPLFATVLEVSCREAAKAASKSCGVASRTESAVVVFDGTRADRDPEVVADKLESTDDEVDDLVTRLGGDPARVLAPAIAAMVRNVLRPTLSLDHLLALVVGDQATRGKRQRDAARDDDDAARRALDAAFRRDEARARRRGDARRLEAARLARAALAALTPAENAFFIAARRAALRDLRASAALGNAPAEVARVLTDPTDPHAQLGFAASLRQLGAVERASRVERFVERVFGVAPAPTAACPSGKFNAGAVGHPSGRFDAAASA